MAYVTEEHDTDYTSVSDFDDFGDVAETAIVAKNTVVSVPRGAEISVPLPPKDWMSEGTQPIVTVTQATSVRLEQQVVVAKATGRAEDAVMATLAGQTAVLSAAGQAHVLPSGTRIGLMKGSQIIMPGAGATQILPTGLYPVVGNPVAEFQTLVGASPDNKYGPETHSKGYKWAQLKAPLFAKAFKKSGPVVLLGQAPMLRDLVKVGALQAAYKAWKARGTSSFAPSSVIPTSEDEARQAGEDVLKQAGFAGWFEDYWWAIAALAAVAGGYMIWKRRKELPAKAGA